MLVKKNSKPNKHLQLLLLCECFVSIPGYRLLAATPIEADVGCWESGARARRAGLMTVRGGAVALIRRHTITAVAVKPCK